MSAQTPFWRAFAQDGNASDKFRIGASQAGDMLGKSSLYRDIRPIPAQLRRQ